MVRQWPLPEGTFTISSRFEGRVNPVTGAAEYHSGVDLAADDGTPFYACAGGMIKYLGPASGYGHWVVIDHPDSEGGGCSEYGHMWSDLPGLSVGDWVDAGQLIGHVGANGEATGPHLHLTVWQREYSGVLVDPETWLAGSPYPPVGGGKASEGTGGSMTSFIVDVSEHQDGMSLIEAAQQGIVGAIVRTTDGTYRDGCYRSHVEDAEAGGMVVAAYHYLRNPSEGTTIAQQVQVSLDVMGDLRRPMWLDCETPAGLTADHIREAKRLFEAAGVRVVGSYSYVPWWEGSVIGGEPDSHEFGQFWVAGYPGGDGTPQQIYAGVGGDGAEQWAYPLGNQRPALWQFTDRALVAAHLVDCSAFRGTQDDLRALFTGGTAAPTQSEEDDMTDTRLILDQMVGPERDAQGPRFTGWPGVPGNGGKTLVEAVAQVQADVAEIKKMLKEIR